ncbi:MAG: hypothetical protein ACRDVW_07915 [Acidimicrobiales bacterium]
MRRIAFLVSTVALVVALTGAGAQAAGPGLANLLVHNGDVKGFVLNGKVETASTPARFVRNIYKETGTGAASATAKLRHEGFTGGASEFLTAAHGLGASQVWAFKDRADARAFLLETLARAKHQLPKGSKVRTVKVDLSGAHVFVAVGSTLSEADAYILAGHCMLFVGDQIAGSGSVAAAPVVAGSRVVVGRARSVCG